MVDFNLTRNSSINHDVFNCFKWNEYFIYFLPLTGFLWLLYSCLVTRTRFYPKICYGRPGAIHPYNSIDGHADRITIIATTVIAVTFIIRLIFNEELLPNMQDSKNYRGLVSLLNILVLASLYYPILASISLAHPLSYFLGTLYIWAYGVTHMLYVIIGCRDKHEKGYPQVYHIIKSLPSILCLFYLMLLFPWKLVSVIHQRITKRVATTNEKVPHQMKYVKHVVFAKKVERVGMDTEMFLKRLWISFLDKLYKPVPGFRYSSRMLSSVAVGSVIVYILSCKFLYFCWKKKSFFCDIRFISATFLKNQNLQKYPNFQTDLNIHNISNIVEEIKASGIDNPVINVVLVISFKVLSKFNDIQYLQYQCNAIFVWSILTVFICDVVLGIIIGLLLTTYRNNLIEIYRRQCTLPKYKSQSNTTILLDCIRLAGYQTAALLWGFILQCVVTWILLALIIEIIIIPIKYSYFSDIAITILGFWPIFLVPVLIILIQLLMVRFFLQKRGAVLALDNRRLLFNFMYFMFFYNIIKGLLLTILRLIKFIIVGAWLMSRLDTSCLSRLDGGMKTYVHFLAIENLQNNPIMNVALYFLSNRSQHISTKTFACISGDFNGRVGDFNQDKRDNINVISNKRLILRNRWWLFVMLYKNPSLQSLRVNRVAVSQIIHENIMAQAKMFHYMFKLTNENECDDRSLSPVAVSDISNNTIHNKELDLENKEVTKL